MEREIIKLIGFENPEDNSRDDSSEICKCVLSSGCKFNLGYLQGYADSTMIIENEDF